MDGYDNDGRTDIFSLANIVLDVKQLTFVFLEVLGLGEANIDSMEKAMKQVSNIYILGKKIVL